jgi:hypothetical protein
MRRRRLLVVGLLAVHALMLGWIGLRTSPTYDEPDLLTPGPSPTGGEGSCCWTAAKGRKPSHRLAETAAGPSGYAAGWRDEVTLLAPALAVFLLVSAHTGFSHHFRYVLPWLPFVFIWISKVARAFALGNRAAAVVGGAALVWSVGSSLWVYPHSMSYFNELTGGPLGGHYHLLDSNIDWGQDLFYLKAWQDHHPEARPLHVTCHGRLNPKLFGIEGPEVPQGMGNRLPPSRDELYRMGPQPGWHAISMHCLQGQGHGYLYLLRLRPVAMAGYSIYIYHITLEEANRARRELGLPELAGPNNGA